MLQEQVKCGEEEVREHKVRTEGSRDLLWPAEGDSQRDRQGWRDNK